MASTPAKRVHIDFPDEEYWGIQKLASHHRTTFKAELLEVLREGVQGRLSRLESEHTDQSVAAA
jgi:hypothetical protein